MTTDSFRSQWVETIEDYIGGRLFDPDAICTDDLKTIAQALESASEESYDDGYADGKSEAIIHAILKEMNEKAPEGTS